MAQLTNDQLELLELLEEAERRKKYNKLEAVFPETGPLRRELYTHAMKFFEAGAKFRDRCFIGEIVAVRHSHSLLRQPTT